MPTMRAKFRVANVEKFESCEVLQFSAVGPNGAYPDDGADENNTYARWTPSAECRMTVNNPALFGKFEIGQEFYVDFTPAD